MRSQIFEIREWVDETGHEVKSELIDIGKAFNEAYVASSKSDAVDINLCDLFEKDDIQSPEKKSTEYQKKSNDEIEKLFDQYEMQEKMSFSDVRKCQEQDLAKSGWKKGFLTYPSKGSRFTDSKSHKNISSLEHLSSGTNFKTQTESNKIKLKPKSESFQTEDNSLDTELKKPLHRSEMLWKKGFLVTSEIKKPSHASQTCRIEKGGKDTLKKISLQSLNQHSNNSTLPKMSSPKSEMKNIHFDCTDEADAVLKISTPVEVNSCCASSTMDKRKMSKFKLRRLGLESL